MSKRRNGEGTIYPDKNGNIWIQLSRKGGQHGPRRKVPKGVDPAEFKRQFEREQEQKHLTGSHPIPKGDTFEALAKQFLDTLMDVAPATVYGYTKQIEHAIRHLGNKPYRDVVFLDIKILYQRLRLDDDLGHEHAVHVLRRVHTAFDLVLEQMPGGRNPVDFRRLKLRKPKRQTELESEEVDFWPVELIREILAAADDIGARGANYRYGIAWWLGFLLGLRRCEIAALRWQDVDWKNATLHVRYHWVMNGTGRGYTMKPGTKNGEPFKQPLGPLLLARLGVQWELHQQDRRRPEWHEQGFIVCKEDGSPLSNLAGVNYRLGALCRDAKLPHCNPHKMRHSFATLLDEIGATDAVKKLALNHISAADVTERYVHGRFERLRSAIEAVEKLIWDHPLSLQGEQNEPVAS